MLDLLSVKVEQLGALLWGLRFPAVLVATLQCHLFPPDWTRTSLSWCRRKPLGQSKSVHQRIICRVKHSPFDAFYKGPSWKFLLCSTIYVEEHHDTSSSPREGQESKKNLQPFKITRVIRVLWVEPFAQKLRCFWRSLNPAIWWINSCQVFILTHLKSLKLLQHLPMKIYKLLNSLCTKTMPFSRLRFQLYRLWSCLSPQIFSAVKNFRCKVVQRWELGSQARPLKPAPNILLKSNDNRTQIEDASMKKYMNYFAHKWKSMTLDANW